MATWTIELLKGFGKLFLNPLLYWFVILGFLISYRRIRRERQFFGMKIFNFYAEWQQTLLLSLLLGLFLSFLTLGIGVVFTQEMLVILIVVTIILSLTMNLTFLSPSYTLGFTFIVMLFLPFISSYTSYSFEAYHYNYYLSVIILLGLLLIIEAIIISRVKRSHLFPRLTLSNRGVWVGLHQIKKLTVIPFFLVIPHGMVVPFAQYWPYFSIGEQTYQFILIPFLLGFNFRNMSSLTEETIRIISRRISLLGLLVIILAIGSMYVPVLSIVTVFVAIIGREAIFYRQRMNDNNGTPFYAPLNNGLRILAVTPNGPADRLGILAGETIVKVNDIEVSTVNEFYEALQNSGASFKLDVIDSVGEIRFLRSAFYETEHHELGIIFPRKPYNVKRTTN